MDVTELQAQITEHERELAALHRRVRGLVACVDVITDEAKEALSEYQERKRLASRALSQASQHYREAQVRLRQVDDLFVELQEIKSHHIELTRGVNGFLSSATDRGEAAQILEAVNATRTQLRELFSEVSRCRTDAFGETESP